MSSNIKKNPLWHWKVNKLQSILKIIAWLEYIVTHVQVEQLNDLSCVKIKRQSGLNGVSGEATSLNVNGEQCWLELRKSVQVFFFTLYT